MEKIEIGWVDIARFVAVFGECHGYPEVFILILAKNSSRIMKASYHHFVVDGMRLFCLRKYSIRNDNSVVAKFCYLIVGAFEEVHLSGRDDEDVAGVVACRRIFWNIAKYEVAKG